MHTRTSISPRAAVLPVLAAIALPAALFAGGMSLSMQDGVHLGQAYSAGAAAEDASTVYFNPAGMVYLDHSQSALSLTYISPSGGFTNTGSVTAGTLPTTGGNGGSAAESRIVPTFYVAHPVSERFALGFGISVPYGLATSYDAGWVGRYQALKSELKTLDFSPVLAWRPTDHVSLGFGLDWQRVSATLTNAIDFGLVGFLNSVPGLTPGSADGGLRVSGSDSSMGFNFGAMFDIADNGRLGVAYRSKVDHTLRGAAAFTDVPAPFAPLFADQKASAAIALPERFSVSYYYDLTPSLAVTADWSWWKWSEFKNLKIDFENVATADVVLPENWHDASIYSAGVRWTQNPVMIWRAGIAYNESPVPSATFRSPRIPDADRFWLCFGASYRFAENVRVDVGFAHLWFHQAPIMNDDNLGHVLVGTYALSANILSVQGTMSF